MKKLLLCIPVLLMQGCSGAASQPADIHMKEDRYEIEQGAQLDIYLPDEGLSCALEALWNKTYPAYRNALHFSQEDKSLQAQIWCGARIRMHGMKQPMLIRLPVLSSIWNIPGPPSLSEQL